MWLCHLLARCHVIRVGTGVQGGVGGDRLSSSGLPDLDNSGKVFLHLLIWDAAGRRRAKGSGRRKTCASRSPKNKKNWSRKPCGLPVRIWPHGRAHYSWKQRTRSSLSRPNGNANRTRLLPPDKPFA